MNNASNIPSGSSPGISNRWATKPRMVSVSPAELIRSSRLPSGGALPLVVQPGLKAVSLTEWMKANWTQVEQWLFSDGGILFRGFGIQDLARFDELLHAAPIELMNYMESATPRKELAKKLYTSTEFPPEHTINLHNELSSSSTFPMKIWFCCVKPSDKGGETPIADVRKVLQRIDPAIRERFIQKGWMLIRNFGTGLGPGWQDSFHLNTRRKVEEYSRNARIECEWKSESRLRTRQVRSAVLKHPRTGETVWFNHIAFWHESSLTPDVREKLLKEYGGDGLPYNTFYGDGSPIEDSIIAELHAAYRAEIIAFPWESGDVLMLDNILVAHGRRPFEGTRQVLVGMGEAYTRPEF